MACFGEPYHLHVCPKCQGVWKCPDDLYGVCREGHVCIKSPFDGPAGSDLECSHVSLPEQDGILGAE